MTPKDNKFGVIRWPGAKRLPDRYGVVEVDKLGPILRGGPYDDKYEANREARRQERRERRRNEREA